MTKVSAPSRPQSTSADADVVRKMKKVSRVMLVILACTSFVAGIPGLLEAGEWAKLGSLAFLVPIAVDGGLIFSSVSGMAWRAERGRRSVVSVVMVVFLSGVSVAAQVAHVAAGAVLTPEVVVGAAIASAFPILVLASSYLYESLQFAAVVEREAARVVRERAAEGASAAVSVQTRTRSESSEMAGAPVLDEVAAQRIERDLLERMRNGDRPTGAEIGALMGKSRKTGDRIRARLEETLERERSGDESPEGLAVAS